MRHVCYIAVLSLCLTTALTLLPYKVQAQQDYTPEDIKSIPAEVFLQRMAKTDDKFAAMHALGLKARESDPDTRKGILNLVISAMNDRSRTEYQRFQCCYVINESKDERGVPYLADVLFGDPSATMRSVAAEALGGFPNSVAAKDALRQAAQHERSQKVLDVINRRLNEGDAEYTPEQIKNISAETFLQRMAKPEPGYDKFAALHALGRKAKESDPETRASILDLVVMTMNDPSRSETQRFQCCYVISDCGDEKWVPYLSDVLFSDPSVTMRSVAAEALGGFTRSTAAMDALRQALLQEKSQRVLDTINRRLSSLEYNAEQIKTTPTETFLYRLDNPEKGYIRFAAMHALGKKAKNADANTRRSVLSLVVATMNDMSRTENQRFQCCYVISECGDELWAPYLVDVLMKDPSATMRAVAAEALGQFPNCVVAHNALVKALNKETNQKVLDVLNRILGKTVPAS
jgi:hypothetical protein